MRHLFQGVELRSSREFSLEGIRTIWVQTAAQDIDFSKEERDGLLVNEYLHEWTEIANVEKKGDALCFTMEKSVPVQISFGGADKTERIRFAVSDSFHGQIYAGTASGDIDFPGGWELENLQVNTASGDINIGNVKAEHFLIETKSGDIDIAGTWGDRQISSISGDICVGDGNGRLSVNSTSGEVDIANRTGGVQIESVSGDIAAKVVSLNGESHISSVSGDVDVAIAAGSPCCITAETVSGDITLQMKTVQIARQNKKSIQIFSGDVPETSKTLEISTVSGDIGLANLTGLQS